MSGTGCAEATGGAAKLALELAARLAASRFLELAGLGVIGTAAQGLAELALGSGDVSLAVERDGEIEVIVGVGGIGGDGFFEVIGGVALVAAAVFGGSDIVEDLGERDALGSGFEGGGSLVEVSEMVFAEAEEEVGFGRGGVVGGNLGEPERGLLVFVRGEVGFGEQENGLRVLGIDGNGGLEIADLVGGAAGKNAADEVLKGIQTDGGRALQKAWRGSEKAGRIWRRTSQASAVWMPIRLFNGPLSTRSGERRRAFISRTWARAVKVWPSKE